MITYLFLKYLNLLSSTTFYANSNLHIKSILSDVMGVKVSKKIG